MKEMNLQIQVATDDDLDENKTQFNKEYVRDIKKRFTRPYIVKFDKGRWLVPPSASISEIVRAIKKETGDL